MHGLFSNKTIFKNLKFDAINPEYLRLERLNVNFVVIAKAFGGQDGEIVESRQDVRTAVQRGIDYVLKTNKSYILDMRTAKDTPPLQSSEAKIQQMFARYVEQPPLNFFHHSNEKSLQTSVLGLPVNVPLIS